MAAWLAARPAACAAVEQSGPDEVIERTLRLERLHTALDAVLADIAAYAHEQALRSLRSPG